MELDLSELTIKELKDYAKYNDIIKGDTNLSRPALIKLIKEVKPNLSEPYMKYGKMYYQPYKKNGEMYYPVRKSYYDVDLFPGADDIYAMYGEQNE